jgi:hypothetical protein
MLMHKSECFRGQRQDRMLDTPLGDIAVISAVLRSTSRDAIDAALTIHKSHGARDRDFPNWLVPPFLITSCLFAESNYETVAEKLAGCYKEIHGPEAELATPTSSGITQARKRLNWRVMETLFRTTSSELAPDAVQTVLLHGLKLRSIDGTTVSLPDTDTNAEEFGYSQTGSTRSAYPQMRAVVLIENSSKVVLDVEIGRGDKLCSEKQLARPIIERMEPGTLLLADRYYPGKEIWDMSVKKQIHLLWRVKADIRLDPVEELPDGSYLAYFCGNNLHGKEENRQKKGTLVRVISYTLGDQDVVYRLITSLMDYKLYPARELARLYAERWDIEVVIKELKIKLKRKILIRSQSADLVKQEFFALLLAHRTVRALMLEAAKFGGRRPETISFERTVEVIKSHLTTVGRFSP